MLYLCLAQLFHGQVSWSCRIRQLHLCGGLSHPNQCSGYDTKQSDGEASNVGALRNAEYPFIVIAPRSILARSVSAWNGPINGSNRVVWHLNSVLLLNWIIWNRTVFYIWLCQKRLLFNWTVSVRWWCLKTFNCANKGLNVNRIIRIRQK